VARELAGVFGSTFKFLLSEKVKSQPNTLASFSKLLFVKTVFFSSTRLKVAFPLLLAIVEVGNFEKITHLPP